MGNATSLFNLMRNLGGSFGIASGTTFLFRRTQYHINLLGANVQPGNHTAVMMTQGLKSMFMGHGSDPVTATKQSYVAIWGMVVQQASMQAFVDTFRALGVVFLLVVPLLLLMKKPTHAPPPGAGMH